MSSDSRALLYARLPDEHESQVRWAQCRWEGRGRIPRSVLYTGTGIPRCEVFVRSINTSDVHPSGDTLSAIRAG